MTKTIGVRVDDEIAKKLDAEAHRLNMLPSALLKQIVCQYFDNLTSTTLSKETSASKTISLDAHQPENLDETLIEPPIILNLNPCKRKLVITCPGNPFYHY